MKKIIIAIILMLFPTNILANTQEISYQNYYEAIVTNPKGAEYKKYDFASKSYKTYTVPNQTKIKVKINNIEYKNIKSSDSIEAIYNNDYNMIKFKDIKINLNSFDEYEDIMERCISSYCYESNSQEIKYFSNEQLKLYAGPADQYRYSEISINYGDSFKYTYIAHTPSMDFDMYGWIFINYNGKKGWVNTIVTQGLYAKYNDIHISANNINIYNDNKVVGTIPENSIIGPNYYSLNHNRDTLYINYNGVSGDINEKYLAYKVQGKYKIIYDHILYESSNEKSKQLINVSANTIISPLYMITKDNKNWYYINYNNKKGWIGLDKKEKIEYIWNDKKTTTKSITTTKNEINNTSIFGKTQLMQGLIITIIILVICFIIVEYLLRYIDKKKELNKIKKQSLIEEDLDNNN